MADSGGHVIRLCAEVIRDACDEIGPTAERWRVLALKAKAEHDALTRERDDLQARLRLLDSEGAKAVERVIAERDEARKEAEEADAGWTDAETRCAVAESERDEARHGRDDYQRLFFGAERKLQTAERALSEAYLRATLDAERIAAAESKGLSSPLHCTLCHARGECCAHEGEPKARGEGE